MEIYIDRFFTYKGLPFLKMNFSQPILALQLMDKGLLSTNEFISISTRLAGGKLEQNHNESFVTPEVIFLSF